MRSHALPLLTAAGASLMLAGCYPPFRHHHRDYKTVTSLSCPQTQGELTRKDASADGKTCDYAGPDGEVVALQLISVTGTDTDTALAPVETKLRAEVPSSGDKDAGGKDAGGKGEGRVDIDLPGIHIHAAGKDTDADGSSSVKIDGGNTVVSGNGPGGVDIEAHDKGAEIRVDDSHGGVRRNFILASETPGPNGYKVAGYDARGPQGGPLVVASLLAKTDDHDRLSDDIHELLRLNVGGGW
jgi:hypothetical protein